MSSKFALIIGNTEYSDPGLAQLTAPGKDAEDFARVLKDQDICAFDDVKPLLNQPEYIVRGAIDDFFDQKKPDDLLVLYFSGHGVRDEFGALYLAVKNTLLHRLRSTAIKSDFIRDVMDQSRSKRQLLILDCCNSGAFAQGMKAEMGGLMGMATALEGTGYGHIVLTASDAIQFAWEGEKVIGETTNSLFTHFLVKGLEGEADQDRDGRITVDDLYEYAYEQIVSLTPKQKPNKTATKQEGEIILRQITRIEDIKPLRLPDDLIDEIEDHRPYVREAAVQKLEKNLKGKNLGLARSAREALERIAADDDSRRVSQAATQVLESFRQAEEERKVRERARPLAAKKAEEGIIAHEQGVDRSVGPIQKFFSKLAHRPTTLLTPEERTEDERRVHEKVEVDSKAQAEAKLLAAQKLEEEQLAHERLSLLRIITIRARKLEAEHVARETAEAERKAREEAEKLAAQKAEQKRLAALKAKARRKQEKEKAEKERIAQAKAKREKEEADRLARQKAEEDRIAKAKIQAEQIRDFTKRMDAIIYGSEIVVRERIPSLIDKISKMLGKKMVQIALQPALYAWRNGNLETLNDIGTKIQNLASHWLNTDEARNTIAGLVTPWSESIRQAIMSQMRAVFKDSKLNIHTIKVPETVEIQIGQNIKANSFEMDFGQTIGLISGAIVAVIIGGLTLAFVLQPGFGIIYGIIYLIAGIYYAVRGAKEAGEGMQNFVENWAKEGKIPVFLRRSLLPEGKIQQILYDSENKFYEEIKKYLTQNMTTEIEKKVSEGIRKFLDSEKEKTINMIKRNT